MKTLKQLARALVRGTIKWPWQLSWPAEPPASRIEPPPARKPPNRSDKSSSFIAGGLAALLMFGLSVPAHARAFEDANRAFAEGRFAESVRGYETLLAKKGYSAPVLFNLGNTFLREGKVGPAILAYERAQLLDPNDPDIAANLQLAREQAGVFVSETPRLEDAAHFLSLNGWSCLASAALTVLCAGILLGQLYRRHRLYFGLLNGAGTITLLIAIAAISIGAQRLDRAVITAKEASARISPFEAAKSAFVLSAGEVVEIKKAHEQFVLIRNREGRTGWTAAKGVARVATSERPRPATRF